MRRGVPDGSGCSQSWYRKPTAPFVTSNSDRSGEMSWTAIISRRVLAIKVVSPPISGSWAIPEPVVQGVPSTK